jgi:hypothetical protein
MLVKRSLTTVLACAEQAQQSRVGFVVDHATRERLLDQVGERLCRPLRLRECVGVAGDIDLVTIDAFLLAAGGLHPQRLGLLAGLQVGRVPLVVGVLGRHLG